MSQRDNWLNWGFILGDWLSIAGAIAIHVLFPNPLVYLVILLVIGSRMRALANLTHEAAHFKLFRNRNMNDTAGRWLCAWPVLIPYGKYVAEHRLHHRYLWLNSQDPDLSLYALTRTERGSRTRESFLKFTMKHVVLVVIPVIPIRRLWHDTVSSGKRLLTLITVLLVSSLIYLLAPRIIVQVVVFGWVIPWLTSFQTVSYWAELGEHAGLRDLGHSWGSRNWRGNIVTRWLIGSHSDDLYHLLHHWFPTVPHHKLRLLDSLCRENWPEYQDRGRCTGFFLGNKQGSSVLRDMWLGEDNGELGMMIGFPDRI
jgi:fatty acid desaturase